MPRAKRSPDTTRQARFRHLLGDLFPADALPGDRIIVREIVAFRGKLIANCYSPTRKQAFSVRDPFTWGEAQDAQAKREGGNE